MLHTEWINSICYFFCFGEGSSDGEPETVLLFFALGSPEHKRVITYSTTYLIANCADQMLSRVRL
jgi:hypothetical protein